MRARCALLAVAAALAQCAGRAGEGGAAGGFPYLPPGFADRVVFYHSFEKGVTAPEIDLIGGGLTCGHTGTVPGLAGRGLEMKNAAAAGSPLKLVSPELSPHKSVTVSLWWRLDAPMVPETCYHILSLGGGKGYISGFVRGKGDWCALKEPTFVFQVYYFPGIGNCNHLEPGGGWVEPGVWHNFTMTAALASEICVYWDGRLRVRYSTRGRNFSREDNVSHADFGPNWAFHPTTIDEILVCDRALTADEIADYVTAVRKLAEVKFPQASGRRFRSGRAQRRTPGRSRRGLQKSAEREP